MSSLKEFLAEEAKKERNKAADRESIRAEWVKAVDELLAQMEGWLRSADEQGVLKIERTTHRVHEPRLGTYEVGGLRITLGTRAVDVEPNARYSMGSIVGDSLGTSIRNGSVHMSTIGHRFMLFRRASAQGDLSWIIADDQDYLPKPLDREGFEHAIKSLLE